MAQTNERIAMTSWIPEEELFADLAAGIQAGIGECLEAARQVDPGVLAKAILETFEWTVESGIDHFVNRRGGLEENKDVPRPQNPSNHVTI